jgi:hypothetical protein
MEWPGEIPAILFGIHALNARGATQASQMAAI